MVSVLDSGAERPGFKSQSRRCRVTVLGKLFTRIVPPFTKQRYILRVGRVTAGLAESNGSFTAGFMTQVTCRLTAKNRDQLRNPTLGSRVWATFTFFEQLSSFDYSVIIENVVLWSDVRKMGIKSEASWE